MRAGSSTCGFRAYRQSRNSPLATLARERATERPEFIEKLRRNLGRKFDSYWYASEKGEWTKRAGWPTAPEDWEKLQGWVVRRKLSRGAATRAAFEREVAAVFRQVYPLYSFTTSPRWNPGR